MNISLPVSSEISALRRRIGDLIETYGNPNTIIAAYAVDAARAGRPSFWKRTTYSNAAVGLICENVNAGADLLEELEEWAQPSLPHATKTALLAELIPLNHAAESAVRVANMVLAAEALS